MACCRYRVLHLGWTDASSRPAFCGTMATRDAPVSDARAISAPHSSPSGTVAESAIASMASNAIVFALSNPDPEVHPDVAGRHALVVATGRSDFPNQINN